MTKISLPGGTSPEKLGYEQARAALSEVVAKMEEGGLELETNIALWERGELLAKICDAFLTAAEEKLAAAEEEE